MNSKGYGIAGEAAAKKLLQDKGYGILDVNFETHIGEIDIIASKGNLVVFVEVKARNNYNYGRPIEAVTAAKAKKIVRVAQQYIVSRQLSSRDIRFDVVEVFGDKLLHTENAFDASGV